MQPPLPARRPDDPGEDPFGQSTPAYDVGEFAQGSPFSRWALARYLVGRVLLERVSWALLAVAIVLFALAAASQFLLHLTVLTVLLVIVAVMVLLMRFVLLAVLRRVMGATHYGPLEDRLGALVSDTGKDVLGELRRVGLPSHTVTLPLIALRLATRRRRDTMDRLRRFEVERAVPRGRIDELHMLLREATGASGGPVPPQRPEEGPPPAPPAAGPA